MKTQIEKLPKSTIKMTVTIENDKVKEFYEKEVEKAIENTANNDRMTMILALNYSSKWEITKAVKEIAQEVKNNVLEVRSHRNDTPLDPYRHIDTSLNSLTDIKLL